MDQMNDRARETQTGDDFLITRREKQKKNTHFFCNYYTLDERKDNKTRTRMKN